MTGRASRDIFCQPEKSRSSMDANGAASSSARRVIAAACSDRRNETLDRVRRSSMASACAATSPGSDGASRLVIPRISFTRSIVTLNSSTRRFDFCLTSA